MKKTLILCMGLLVLVAGLSACQGKAADLNLSGTSWVLVSQGKAGALTAAVSPATTELDFNTDATLSGNMGCNSFGGNYTVSGSTIAFSQVISTMMACSDALNAQEKTAFAVMNGNTTATLSGDTLTIVSAEAGEELVLKKK